MTLCCDQFSKVYLPDTFYCYIFLFFVHKHPGPINHSVRRSAYPKAFVFEKRSGHLIGHWQYFRSALDINKLALIFCINWYTFEFTMLKVIFISGCRWITHKTLYACNHLYLSLKQCYYTVFLNTIESIHGLMAVILAYTPYKFRLAQPTPHDIAPHKNHIFSFVVESFLLQTKGPPESPSQASIEPFL